MKISMQFNILLVVFFIFASKSSILAQNPLIANWQITLSASERDWSGTLNLENGTSGYKGDIMTFMGGNTLRNIVITSNVFSAAVTLQVEGQIKEGTITGKLENGVISGELNLQTLGVYPFTGKKG